MSDLYGPDHLKVAAALIEKIDADAAAAMTNGDDAQVPIEQRAQLHLLLSIADSLNSLYQHGIDITGGRLSVDSG